MFKKIKCLFHLFDIQNNINDSTKIFWEIKKNYKETVKILRRKTTINVTFLVSIVSMFPGKPLFDYLLSKKKRYNVKILVIPDFRFGIENTIKLQEECYKELSEEYGADFITKVPINEEDDNIDLKSISDIVFCSLPYDVSHKKYALDNLIVTGLLPVMVNYGYFRSKYDRNLISSEQYSKYWKIFIENKQNLSEYKQYQIIKGKNCTLTGYCKLDNYLRFEKTCPQKNKKTIMIAPHHSVSGGFNDILSLSNFYKYSDLFLKLPDLYPDINFIFRPHPALFLCLSNENFWGQEKSEKYICEMKNKQNVRYSDTGNYLLDFAESDAIIQDCGSFLVDYFYTLKPQCYMLKSKEQIETTFSNFGKDCLENVYQAFSEDDIINFINDVVINNNDVLKGKREQFAKENVMINYPNASKKAVKFLDRTFFGGLIV